MPATKILRRIGFFYNLPLLDRIHILRALAQAREDAEEAAIVGYLESGRPYAAVPAVEDDVLLDDRPFIGPLHILTDGVFAWPRTLSYWVRRHHVRLPPEFVAHMKGADWVIPQDVDFKGTTLD